VDNYGTPEYYDDDLDFGDENEFQLNHEGDDYLDDADEDRGFQNPVFEQDWGKFTPDYDPEENLDDLLDEFGF
jgi:hypothetical protein